MLSGEDDLQTPVMLYSAKSITISYVDVKQKNVSRDSSAERYFIIADHQ